MTKLDNLKEQHKAILKNISKCEAMASALIEEGDIKGAQTWINSMDKYRADAAYTNKLICEAA